MQGLELLEPPPEGCKLARAIAVLARDDPDGAAKLSAAVGNHQITASVIAKVLTMNGQSAGETAVRSHRRGECSCAR